MSTRAVLLLIFAFVTFSSAQTLNQCTSTSCGVDRPLAGSDCAGPTYACVSGTNGGCFWNLTCACVCTSDRLAPPDSTCVLSTGPAGVTCAWVAPSTSSVSSSSATPVSSSSSTCCAALAAPVIPSYCLGPSSECVPDRSTNAGCSWNISCNCECEDVTFIAPATCTYTSGTSSTTRTCSWVNDPIATSSSSTAPTPTTTVSRCLSPQPANSGSCSCVQDLSTGVFWWRCTHPQCDAVRPDDGTCVCEQRPLGNVWSCTTAPTGEVCGTNTVAPYSDCTCHCTTLISLTGESRTQCQYSCPSQCPRTSISIACPCLRTLNGWEWRCPQASPTPTPTTQPTTSPTSTYNNCELRTPPAPDCVCVRVLSSTNTVIGFDWQCPLPPPTTVPTPSSTPCFGINSDSSKCQCNCVSGSDLLTNTATSSYCLYTCEASLCAAITPAPAENCRCLQVPTDFSSGTRYTYRWSCPVVSPPTTASPSAPVPTTIVPPPTCTTSAPRSDCRCLCATIRSLDSSAAETVCDWICPPPTTCQGFPPTSSCTCQLAGRDATGAPLYDWFCPNVSPCTTTPSSRECVCSVVGLSADGTRKFDWVCPTVSTCIGEAPRSDCRCAPTYTTTTNEQAGWAWQCPLVCSGAAPGSNCFCGLSPDSRTPTWQCRDLCPLSTKRDGCFCGRTATGTLGWICPPSCNSTYAPPRTLDCASPLARCDPTTGQWTYRCPSRVCSCDGLPLPTLDAARDGCTTREAKWTCQQLATSFDSATTTATTNFDTSLTRTCAAWVFTCPSTTTPPPPSPTCQMYPVCNNMECIDSSVGLPAVRCLPNLVFDCNYICTRQFATCAKTRVTGVESCAFQYTVDYRMCMQRCSAASGTPINTTVDRCSFIADKCSCAATNGACGWCSSSVVIDGRTIERGRCMQVASNAACINEGYTFATAISSCPATSDPRPLPAPIVESNPRNEEVAQCVNDARCFDPIRATQSIEATRTASDAPAVLRNYIIVVTLVINSNVERGDLSVAVDTIGQGSPSDAERAEICRIVQRNIFTALRVDESRFRTCRMISAATTKRQAATSGSITTSHVVDITMDNRQSSASSVVLAFSALIAAVVAFF